jgi:hypothetical protein
LDDNGDIGENGAFLRSEVINKWETRTRWKQIGENNRSSRIRSYAMMAILINVTHCKHTCARPPMCVFINNWWRSKQPIRGVQNSANDILVWKKKLAYRREIRMPDHEDMKRDFPCNSAICWWLHIIHGIGGFLWDIDMQRIRIDASDRFISWNNEHCTELCF